MNKTITIQVEYVKGDKLLIGKPLSFAELKNAVREIFETHDEDGFVAAFCARFGYRELPFSQGHFEYLIDLDTRLVFMSTFPKKLDGANVLYYSDRSEYEPVRYAGGAAAHNVIYLAICKYENDASYYLFHVDENFDVVADDCFDSIEACKKIMDEYNVNWHEPKK
ncbi:MAG: hypothetical protein IJW70_06365 [Clostridia bacterium]|nr:hypothetical protein [Clostridia bacterium]